MKNFRTNCIITGAILIVLGVLALRYPIEAMMTVGYFIGLGLVVSGINYFSAFYFFGLKRFVFLGLIDFIMGLYLTLQPGFAALVIPFAIGIWLVFAGLSRIAMSLWLGGAEVRGWWMMLLNGAAFCAMGAVLFVSPLNASLSVMLMMLLGGAFIASGVLSVLEGCIMHTQ